MTSTGGKAWTLLLSTETANLVDANVEFQINKRQGLKRNKMTDFGTGDGRIWVSADTP